MASTAPGPEPLATARGDVYPTTTIDRPGLPYTVVIRKGADGMEVEKTQRPEAPADLAAIANASLEELEGSGV